MQVKPYILFWLLLPVVAFSQATTADTVVDLAPFTVYSARIDWSGTGQQQLVLDSLMRSEDPGATLGELLSSNTAISVNSYGQGSLATLKMRGTSASHSGILWNGVSISPPNIGFTDLSLIQGRLFDEITVTPGGASPRFGTGFIAGSIRLDNRPSFGTKKDELSFSATAGSFGLLDLGASGAYSFKKLYTFTGLNYSGQNNDFPYTDLYGERVKLQHAAFNRFSGMQNLAFATARDQFIMASLWVQYADRDIPPTMTMDRSEANQVDRSFRFLLQWKDINPNSVLEARVSYFNEFTRYADPVADVYSVIRTHSYTASFESEFRLFENSKLFGGLNYYLDQAELTNYDGIKDEQRIALAASFFQPFTSVDWNLTVNLRQEYLSKGLSPFTFSLGLDGAVAGGLSARFNLSRNYRTPTMNERYWEPGGNPGLDPETSWNVEGGIDWRKISDKFMGNFGLTGFSSWVRDWILWVPSGNLWHVENRQTVWSRGVEVSGSQKVSVGSLYLIFNEGYSFTRVASESDESVDENKGKQLIYTPMHQLMLKAGMQWKGYYLMARNTWRSKSYTSSDNSDFLPGYALLDAMVSKSFPVKELFIAEVQLAANNLLNTSYQSVPYRPMPGINWRVTIKINLN